MFTYPDASPLVEMFDRPSPFLSFITGKPMPAPKSRPAIIPTSNGPAPKPKDVTAALLHIMCDKVIWRSGHYTKRQTSDGYVYVSSPGTDDLNWRGNGNSARRRLGQWPIPSDDGCQWYNRDGSPAEDW